jgi:hypothetical protein
MGGTIVIIVVLTVIVPVSIIMSGLVASGVLGFILKRDADLTHAGSELLALSQKDFYAETD